MGAEPREPVAERLASLGLSDALEAVVAALPMGVIFAAAPSGSLLFGNGEVDAIWRRPFLRAATVGEYEGYQGFWLDGTALRAEDWPLARSILDGQTVRDELIEIERGDRTRGIIQCDSAAIRGADGEIAAGIVVFRDVTEQVQAERGLRLLAATGKLFDDLRHPEKRLADVARLWVPALGDVCTVYLSQPGGRIIRHLAATDPEVEGVLGSLLGEVDPQGDSPVARVLRGGEAEVVPELPIELVRQQLKDPSRSEEFAPIAALVLPLRTQAGTIGALAVWTVARRRVYSDLETRTAHELASRCAIALENSSTYAREHAVASALSAALRPDRLPTAPGVAIEAAFLPAPSELGVSGDFYDVFETADGWAVAIGDVCGKGAGAAAVTAAARHTIRAATLRDPAPAGVLETLNQALLRFSAVPLCTVVYGLVRASADGLEISLATGGHPPPIRVTPEAAGFLDVHGTVLGVVREPEAETRTFTLAPGETLLLYTDGLTESRLGGDLLGEARVLDLCAQGDPDPAALVGRLVAHLERPGVSRRDDVALLALQAPAA